MLGAKRKREATIQIGFGNIVHVVFAAQAIVYGLLTYSQPRLRPFMLLLMAFALHMTVNFIIETDQYSGFPDITFAFRFAYGPLIYLFVREIIRLKSGMALRDFIHGVPFLIALPLADSSVIYDVLGVSSLTVYMVLAATLVRSVEKGRENVVSDAFASRLTWIAQTFWVILGISIFDVGRAVGGRIYPILNADWIAAVSLVALLVTVNWFAIKAVRYPLAFEGFSAEDIAIMNDEEQPAEQLGAEDIHKISAVIEHLEKNKLYLQPSLKLSELAKATQTQERFLSRAIYLHTGDRFNKYVNKLRVDAAKEIIKAAPNGPLNILALSFEAGFNSKSSFNYVFKEITGLTPSQYRADQQKRPES